MLLQYVVHSISATLSIYALDILPGSKDNNWIVLLDWLFSKLDSKIYVSHRQVAAVIINGPMVQSSQCKKLPPFSSCTPESPVENGEFNEEEVEEEEEEEGGDDWEVSEWEEMEEEKEGNDIWDEDKIETEEEEDDWEVDESEDGMDEDDIWDAIIIDTEDEDWVLTPPIY